MLIKQLPPDMICHELGICTESDDVPFSCELCTWFVEELDKWVTENKTEEEIIVFVKNVCNILPEGFFREQCQKLIEAYLPEVEFFYSSSIFLRLLNISSLKNHLNFYANIWKFALHHLMKKSFVVFANG